MERFRIHFTDNYGSATIGCKTYKEFTEALNNIHNDPMCEDIWTEQYDDEEGWQA